MLKLDTPVTVNAGEVYTLTLGILDSNRVLNACGPVDANPADLHPAITQTVPGPDHCLVQSASPYAITIPIQESGLLEAVTLSQLVDQTAPAGLQTLELTIRPGGDDQQGSTASLTADLAPGPSGLGAGYTMTLDRPIRFEAGENYSLSLALTSGDGVVSVRGSAVANEGDWDDGLPLRVEGYDAFSGIYTPGLNFNMYTDDNSDKLEHFINVYDQSEYLLISSNRQWGSLPRLPERFPMTSLHYRHLLGCPDDKTILGATALLSRVCSMETWVLSWWQYFNRIPRSVHSA